MKTIYVFDDFSGDTPVHMGNLYVDVIKGGESYSFEYTEEWLKQNSGNASVDPDLFPFVGRQFPNGNSIFGVFSVRSAFQILDLPPVNLRILRLPERRIHS